MCLLVPAEGVDEVRRPFPEGDCQVGWSGLVDAEIVDGAGVRANDVASSRSGWVARRLAFGLVHGHRNLQRTYLV